MTQEINSPAAKFSRETTHETRTADDGETEEWDIDASGATVPEDHPRAAGNDDDELEAEREAFKESRPDPRDAENVPDHECDHPDAPWM